MLDIAPGTLVIGDEPRGPENLPPVLRVLLFLARVYSLFEFPGR